MIPSYLISVFSMEIRRTLSYRVDFWIQFLGNIIAQIGLAYFLWRAVFDARGVDSMNGYTFHGLMFYYTLVPLVERMVRGPEMNHIAQEIYDGGLNRYLIYPVHFFLYKYASHAAQSLLFYLQFVLGITGFLLIFGRPPEATITLSGFVMGWIVIMIASLLYFLMATILEMVAFWADHVWSLMVMLRFIVYFGGGGMIPLAFFPDELADLLNYLPFPYMTSFPIRSFFGDVTFAEFQRALIVLAVWSLFSAAAANGIWKLGVRKYSGVGI